MYKFLIKSLKFKIDGFFGISCGIVSWVLIISIIMLITFLIYQIMKMVTKDDFIVLLLVVIMCLCLVIKFGEKINKTSNIKIVNNTTENVIEYGYILNN